MNTASSKEGSVTKIGWKRRSKAASFSIYFWYSFKVVAPIQCKVPRAKAGFNRFAASIAPSVAPAPTKVCTSSMNRIHSPSEASTPFNTLFNRSSNSPRYLAPAIKAPISSTYRCFSFKLSGTSPCTMRRASPSAIAVFPTPGSPINIGLFFVRLERTCIVRLISSSRPITGSSLPSLASTVKFLQYFSNPFRFSSALGESIRLPCLNLVINSFNASEVVFTVFLQEAKGSLVDRQKASNK
ncbi:Uncharacterised protein [Chlamydia trachomatis]|nr:Uncharacterised protein [Chlamydia trachomatis]CRH46558.1 Uncharacterised protein [Chlamydia trachomatis]CRI74635.1 Uncharacterised protein [Chlamydia trachomatis]